jgi:hypothetical protein
MPYVHTSFTNPAKEGGYASFAIPVNNPPVLFSQQVYVYSESVLKQALSFETLKCVAFKETFHIDSVVDCWFLKHKVYRFRLLCDRLQKDKTVQPFCLRLS